MLSFLARTPATFLAALGLLSLASNVLDIQKNVQDWIDAWTTVTRPVWDYTIALLAPLLGFDLKNWMKDYLTVGVIVAGMHIRFRFVYERQFAAFYEQHPGSGAAPVVTPAPEMLKYFLYIPLIWPLSLVLQLYMTYLVHFKFYDFYWTKHDVDHDSGIMTSKLYDYAARRWLVTAEVFEGEKKIYRNALSVYWETIMFFVALIVFSYGLSVIFSGDAAP